MDAVPSENKPTRGAKTLVERVATSLRQAIASGEYKPGEKLPSEAQLTDAHKVSRTVIREAIAALRSDGLVEARQGAGVFVLEPEADPTRPFRQVDSARVSSTIEFLELRTAIEVEAAGLAAVRRSPAAEEAMFRAFHELQACYDKGQSTNEADFALHLAIAQATNNPRFPEFLEMLGSSIIPRTALKPLGVEPASPEHIDRLSEEHGAIVTAISNGDEQAARDAMRHHLKGSQARYRALLRSK